MDVIQALALLTLGAFLAVLVTALVYIFAVRPRLLASTSSESAGTLERTLLQEDLLEQRSALERLAETIERRTSAVTAEARDPVEPEAVETLKTMLSDQSAQLGWVDSRLTHHEGKLDQIASRLDSLLPQGDGTGAERGVTLRDEDDDGASSLLTLTDKLDVVAGQMRTLAPASALERLEIRVEQVSKRLDDMVPAEAYDSMRALLQEQADALAELRTAWREQVAAVDLPEDEAVRTGSALEERLEAQAALTAQIDAKVSENATLLLEAATERQEQVQLIERAAGLMEQLYPLLDGLVNLHVPPGRDRLTDIRGIGPVYAAKLYEAGVDTFEELAGLTPEEIQSIVKLPRWRMRETDFTQWIEEARLLAERQKKLED